MKNSSAFYGEPVVPQLVSRICEAFADSDSSQDRVEALLSVAELVVAAEEIEKAMPQATFCCAMNTERN